jgi:tRNA A-37 threonylcarbamoyl transferase component Bud32
VIGHEGASRTLALVNEIHESTWSIVRRLAGGSQQGAYELRDSHGMRAVLKWHTRHLSAQQLGETARIIEIARMRGWPTPRWLAYGPLAREGAYVIEEYIDGRTPMVIDDEILDQLLELNRKQADLVPDSGHDWSAYVRRTVFEDPAGDLARLRDHAATACLAADIARAVDPMRAVRLPENDLVHGDFTLRNVIVRDGRPYLVDAGHAGKGTRAYDLATFLVDEAQLSPGHRRRVLEECRSVGGTDGALICAVSRMIVLMEWGLRHWPPSDVPRAVERCEALIEELQGA